MSFLLIVFFFTLRISLYDGKECSQTNVPTFIIDGYLPLQSPNFPRNLYTNNMTSTCDAKFIAKNENDYIWITLLNGASPQIEVLDINNTAVEFLLEGYQSNRDIFIFSPTLNYLTFKVFPSNSLKMPWAAFQAFAYTFDPFTSNITCPLSGSKNEIFDFISNPEAIIPVTSSFEGDPDYSNKTCKWSFKILSSQQQLKIVIRNLYLALNSSFILYADGNLIYNFTEKINLSTPPTVLYLDGEIFDFIFAKNMGENLDENVFALVSAVEKSNTFTSEGCQMIQFNSTATVFTNIDYTNGYRSYQHCEHMINIPLNHEGNIGLLETNYEACCDSLTIVENKSNTTHEWNVSNLRKHFSINSKANGSRITFTSDGNVQEAGYKAVLNIYECLCGNQEYIVECNNSIRITPLNGNIDYCDNMNCTYQISSNCPNNYFRLDPYIDSLRPEYDQLLLLNNGKVVENYTKKDYIDGYELFLYNNNFTLTFNSGISNENISYEKFWHLDIIPIYPVITKVLLDTDMPNHAIWIANIKKNDAYSVCTKSNILEMFITGESDNIKLRHFLLYDNDGLQNYVGRLSSALNSTSNSLPRSLKSKSGCFTIFNTENYDYLYYSNHTILFKTIDESISNCGNKFTVFQVSSPDFFIINSTNSGPCKASFLTDNTYFKSFPYIWIEQMYTSSTENFVFISEMNNKKFLNISLNDKYKWADFVMFTPALSIVIPASTYLIIKFSTEHKTISMQPQKLVKGIFASPSYFGIFDTFEMLEFPIVISPFTDLLAKVMHGTPDVVIKETQSNITTNYTLTSSEHLLIYGQFQLIYAEKNPSKNNFLIEYTLQENGPATSTFVLTTTTPMTTKTATSFISLTSQSITTLLPNNSVATATPKMTTLSSAKTSTVSATTIQNHNFAAIKKPDIFMNFYTVLSYVVYYLFF